MYLAICCCSQISLISYRPRLVALVTSLNLPLLDCLFFSSQTAFHFS
jgi:hypothetical protein